MLESGYGINPSLSNTLFFDFNTINLYNYPIYIYINKCAYLVKRTGLSNKLKQHADHALQILMNVRTRQFTVVTNTRSAGELSFFRYVYA